MKSISTKRLSLLAMFIALQIVLSKFLMLQLAPSVRLSIDSVPILLAGIWFGPIAGGLVGALADFLGTILFPTAGAYFPLLTVAFLLIGVVAGLLSRIVKHPMIDGQCIAISADWEPCCALSDNQEIHFAIFLSGGKGVDPSPNIFHLF